MSNFCIMRIKKLHTNANVGGAISHHLRTRETDNADPDKMKKNWFYPNDYDKTPDGYTDKSKNADMDYRRKQQNKAMSMYKKRLPEKIRKNGVRAVEFMMTVSPGIMQKKDFNAIKYLNACDNWAREKFGKENVFFIAQHFDETTPHVSLLLTPIDENGKLNARKFFGGREKMSALQDDFYEKVGKEFGLERGIKGSRAKHETIKSYYSKLNEQEKNVAELTNEIANNLPEKKFLQSEQEHQADVYYFVKNELEQIKPTLEKSLTAEQTEKRLAELRKNFDGQVRQKVAQKEQELEQSFDEKVSQKTKLLQRENAELQDYKKMVTEKTVITGLDGKPINCQTGLLNGVKNATDKLLKLNKDYNELVNEWNNFITDPQAMRKQIETIEQEQERKYSGNSR